MKRLLFAALILASATTIISAALQSKGEQPKVIKAVAHRFPAVARAARQDGKVIVEVKLNAAGDVLTAKPVEGPPLLVAAGADAARLWKFEPGADGRTARLTFIFTFGDEQYATVTFIPPYGVEFKSGRITLDY